MSFGDNEMMMDLFRSEVESHSEVLSSALLKLERDASDLSVYDSMMRSAHSIKGAARIVRVESAVLISHVMEDCFVAAQRGELTIHPSDFDLLLRSVDLLGRIAEATRENDALLEQLSGEVQDCVDQLKCLREGRPYASESPVDTLSGQPVTIPGTRSTGNVPPTVETLAGSAVNTSTPNAPVAEPTAPAPSTAPTAISPEQTAPVNLPAILVLDCGQSLCRNHAETLRQALLRDIRPEVSEVCFDLSLTEEIDAIGLAFLAAAKHHVESHSVARVSFSPVSDRMKLVLRVTGIVPS